MELFLLKIQRPNTNTSPINPNEAPNRNMGGGDHPQHHGDAAYIPNPRPQFEDKAFEKGMGFDVYFDGCKLLPENVSLVKAIVEIIDIDMNSITAESDVAELDSSCYNPTFDWKIEVRPANLVPTALALITLMTVDISSNQPRVIGYSAMNLFISRTSRKQPQANNETVSFLFEIFPEWFIHRIFLCSLATTNFRSTAKKFPERSPSRSKRCNQPH